MGPEELGGDTRRGCVLPGGISEISIGYWDAGVPDSSEPSDYEILPWFGDQGETVPAALQNAAGMDGPLWR